MQALYDQYLKSSSAVLVFERDEADPDFRLRVRAARWLRDNGLIEAKFAALDDFQAKLTDAGQDFVESGGMDLWSMPEARPHEPSTSDGPIDIAILTALEMERKAVCAALGFNKSHRIKRSERSYWRGRLPLEDGSHYQVVVAQAIDMGQVEATGLTKDVLHDWQPAAALLVGIAASTDPNRVKLGDVVVGRSVWYYEHGKVTEEGTEPQPEMIHADAGLLKHFTGLADWDDAIGEERPDGTGTRPKVYAGVIASGEKVIADESTRQRIVARQRKIIAIAMEDYGFSRAISHSSDRVRHLVIRGICDDATPAKDDRWHPYAAAAAAAFAKHFLLDRPIEPLTTQLSRPLAPSAKPSGHVPDVRPADNAATNLAHGQHGARVVVVDDMNVYWATGDAIMCIAKANGTIRRLAAANTFHLAVDDSSIYWAEEDKVMSFATTGEAVPNVLAEDENAPTYVAVDDNYIYWTNCGGRAADGEVKKDHKVLFTPGTRAMLGGPEAIAAGEYGPGFIVVDNIHVYWANCKAGAVMKARKDGEGSPVELAPGRSYQTYGGLTVDNNNVYWTVQDQKNSENGALMKAPISGEPHYPLAAGQMDPRDVVVDLRNVYWVAGCCIHRIAKTGGRITTLVTEDDPIGGLAIDDTSIYWTVPSRGLVRMRGK